MDKITLVRRLRKRDYRRQTGWVIVEGVPEFRQALAAGVMCQRLFWCPELLPWPDDFPQLEQTETVSREEFKAMAFGDRLKGLLAICIYPHTDLAAITIDSQSKIVILDGLEKPGNIGTVVRTADGAGVDAVFLTHSRTDAGNHHVVRSSMGAVFHCPTVDVAAEALDQALQKTKLPIITTSAHAKKAYADVNLSAGFAIVIGSEHAAITPFWKKRSTHQVRMLMEGHGRCLNAAVSAAIMMYEAQRQRLSLKRD